MATTRPAPTTAPPLSATECDARCPATSLVMVSKATPPAGWTEAGRTDGGTPIYHAPAGTAPAVPEFGYLTFCAHHYHEQALMLAAHGWRVVADMRVWKADQT